MWHLTSCSHKTRLQCAVGRPRRGWNTPTALTMQRASMLGDTPAVSRLFLGCQPRNATRKCAAMGRAMSSLRGWCTATSGAGWATRIRRRRVGVASCWPGTGTAVACNTVPSRWSARTCHACASRNAPRTSPARLAAASKRPRPGMAPHPPSRPGIAATAGPHTNMPCHTYAVCKNQTHRAPPLPSRVRSPAPAPHEPSQQHQGQQAPAQHCHQLAHGSAPASVAGPNQSQKSASRSTTCSASMMLEDAVARPRRCCSALWAARCARVRPHAGVGATSHEPLRRRRRGCNESGANWPHSANL